GSDLTRLDGPKFEKGYLPIVHLRYRHEGRVFEEEIFTSCDPMLARYGVVFARFSLPEGDDGKLETQLEWPTLLNEKDGIVRDKPPEWAQQQQPDPEAILNNRVGGGGGATSKSASPVLICFDKGKWIFNVARN